MRLYDLLAKIVQAITDDSTFKDHRVLFPNGLKICWGRASALTSGSIVKISETFMESIAMVFPYYYNANSMRCVYTGDVDGDELVVYAFDMRTAANYTEHDLYISYLVIGF